MNYLEFENKIEEAFNELKDYFNVDKQYDVELIFDVVEDNDIDDEFITILLVENNTKYESGKIIIDLDCIYAQEIDIDDKYKQAVAVLINGIMQIQMRYTTNITKELYNNGQITETEFNLTMDNLYLFTDKFSDIIADTIIDSGKLEHILNMREI